MEGAWAFRPEQPASREKKVSLMRPAGKIRDSVSRFGGVAALTPVFLVLTLMSWKKWSDPVIDWGRELYLPWRISTGEIMGRDFPHLYGPFSHYFNAGIFHIFGVSMNSLIFVNLLILFTALLLIYSYWRKIADPGSAFLAGVVFLGIFAFGNYTIVSNFNFVTPYSHETTHGIVLTLIMLRGFIRFKNGGVLSGLGVAGLSLGLLLMTRIEHVLAGAGTAVCAFTLLFIFRRHLPRKPDAVCFSVFVLWMILPLLTAWILFGLFLSWHQSLRIVFGAFQPILLDSASNMYFFRRGMGLDEPLRNLQILFLSWMLVAAFWFGMQKVSRLIAAKSARPERTALIVTGIGASAILSLFAIEGAGTVFLTLPARSLPLLCLSVFCVTAALWIIRKYDTGWLKEHFELILWTVWAGLLTAKMLLMSRVFHYGYYLGMPAGILAAIIFLYYLPRSAAHNPPQQRILIMFANILVILFTVCHLAWSFNLYRLKTFTIGEGADSFRTFSGENRFAGPVMEEARRYLEENAMPGDTLVAYPEGAMLNYLTRMPSSIYYYDYMTAKFLGADDRDVLRNLYDANPSYVAYIHRDASEHQLPNFGTAELNGKVIKERISEHYKIVKTIRHEPFVSDQFGIQILRLSEICPWHAKLPCLGKE